MKLEQADLDAIADAVVAKLNATKSSTETPTKAAAKPAAKPKAEAAPKAETAVTRDDVFAALNAHAKRNDKTKAVAILQEYSPSLGKLDESKFAEVKAKLDADIAPAGDDSAEDPFA